MERLHSWLFSLESLKKPVGELLMHIGETYRQIREEQELIDRALPTQHDGKARTRMAFPKRRVRRLDAEMAASVCTLGDKIYPLQSIVKPWRPLPKLHHWSYYWAFRDWPVKEFSLCWSLVVNLRRKIAQVLSYYNSRSVLS